jgi:hypothetical protein
MRCSSHQKIIPYHRLSCFVIFRLLIVAFPSYGMPIIVRRLVFRIDVSFVQSYRHGSYALAYQQNATFLISSNKQNRCRNDRLNRKAFCLSV